MKVIEVPAQPKPVEVPLSLRAAAKLIDRHKAKEPDDVLDMMVRGAESLTADSELITTACEKIMANQMQSGLQNASAARRRVVEIAAKATAKLDADRDRAERGIARLEAAVVPQKPKEIMSEVTSQIYAGEIRAVLRSMPPDERTKAVVQAIESADESFVGAVLSGSPALTGLGAAELAMFKDRWSRKWHGPTLERIARLRSALSDLDRLSGLFSKWSSGVFAAEQIAAIAAAEQSERLARAAMSADVA